VSKEEIGIWEINEAFASQAVYCVRELGIDQNKVNPKGGAIAVSQFLQTDRAALFFLRTDLTLIVHPTDIFSLARTPSRCHRCKTTCRSATRDGETGPAARCDQHVHWHRYGNGQSDCQGISCSEAKVGACKYVYRIESRSTAVSGSRLFLFLVLLVGFLAE